MTVDVLDCVGDLTKWTTFYPNDGPYPVEIELHRGKNARELHLKKEEDIPTMCGWASPYFEVIPGQYYRLSMTCNSNLYGFWEAQFYEDDREEPSDFYTNSVPDTCGGDRDREWCFYGKYRTQKCRIVLWPASIGHATIKNAQLEMTENEVVEEWFDTFLGETEPALENVKFPSIRTDYLDSTLDALNQSTTSSFVDIVVYGDSIAFDMGNLPLDVFLKNAYPGTKIRIHTRGKSATGWDELRDPDILEELISPLNPDLVVCQGVSTDPDVIPQALPELIEQVRYRSNAELLLMTDHRSTGKVQDDRGAGYWDACAEATREVGEKKECAVLDLRAVMKKILTNARPPADRLRWFLRDSSCHLNDRGRAVVLRLLMRALVP